MAAVPAYQLLHEERAGSGSISAVDKSPNVTFGIESSERDVLPGKNALLACGAAIGAVSLKLAAGQHGASDSWRYSATILDALAAAYILGYPLRAFLVQFFKRPTNGHELLLVSILCVASLFLLHQLAFQFSALINQPWSYSVSLLFGAVALICYIDGTLRTALSNSFGFDLARLMPKARVVKLVDADDASNSNESWQATAELKPHDIVKLEAGDFVPCDGVVVNGQAEVEDRRLSGLSARRVKSNGHELWAGSRLAHGQLTYRIVSNSEDSFISYSSAALAATLRPLTEKIAATNLKFGSINIGILVGAVFSGVLWLEKGASSFAAAAVLESILIAGLFIRGFILAGYVPLLSLTRLWTKGVLARDWAVIDSVANAKAVAIDLDPNAQPGASVVQHFEVIDERVDRPRLMAALLTLLGQSDSERDLEMVRFLSQEVKEPLVKEVRGFCTYPELGLCGELDGIEVTIGTESFLLERGVQLQASESVGDSPDVLYVALNDSVVARFDIGSEFKTSGKELIRDLHRTGLKTWIMSAAANNIIDPIAKAIGIELAYVAGELSTTKYSEKLESIAPCLFYSGIHNSSNPVANASSNNRVVTMSVFDDVSWNLSHTTLTVFCRRLAPIIETIKLAKRAQFVASCLCWSGILLAFAMAITAYLINPGAAMFALVGAAFLIAVSSLFKSLSPGFLPSPNQQPSK